MRLKARRPPCPARATHDVAARLGQTIYLGQGGLGVPVSVLVMDCTATGAPPPRGTAPTMMRLVVFLV